MKEQDEILRKLKTTKAKQMDRLNCSLDEQSQQFQQQRSALEQHYKQIVYDMSSRNEVITASSCF